MSARITQGQKRNERLAEWAHYEDLFALAEAEKAKIEEELATPGLVVDFSAKQRRLSELYVDIAADTEAWDKESTALAELLEKYEAIGKE